MLKTTNEFDPEGYWEHPVAKILFSPTAEDVELFDQNGYDLTPLERHFAYGNRQKFRKHRDYRYALKKDWYTQSYKIEGAVLNHSNLYERKGYKGEALQQLKSWARQLPLVHKVIAIRPKWGLDFSMDWVDQDGNVFEILHWEWDSFDYEEIQEVKSKIEPVLDKIDWEAAARQLLLYKDGWSHLPFFAQSDWKCNYFGIPREQFKMVIWK
jgi:hypothetical protein